MKTELLRAREALGFEKFRRHIFLCADATEPECCSVRDSQAAWDYLKRRLKELRLVGPQPLVFRTKANCLRVCAQGPIAVVYPEGVWYHSATPEVLERIIQEHLTIHVDVEPDHIIWAHGNALRHMKIDRTGEVLQAYRKAMSFWQEFWSLAFTRLNYPGNP